MGQKEKSAAFQTLKAAGVQFDKHYREYTTEELEAAVAKLEAGTAKPTPAPAPPTIEEPELTPEELAAIGIRSTPAGGQGAFAEPLPAEPEPVATTSTLVNKPKDANELPAQRLNTLDEWEPLRTDDEGRIWYQEEVRKPAFAKPRGRRVLQYMESGTTTETVQNGEYVETFEVAGKSAPRAETVKITLPSYQVGIFKDKRFPWKVHIYNEQMGFNLFEVQDYFGGAEMVPAEIKRIYVENVLCYDIRTTVRAIQTEFRQQQLAGRQIR